MGIVLDSILIGDTICDALSGAHTLRNCPALSPGRESRNQVFAETRYTSRALVSIVMKVIATAAKRPPVCFNRVAEARRRSSPALEETMAMLDLAPLYAPIREDLKRVDQVLLQELRSSISSVDLLCRHVERYRGKMLRPAVLLLSGRACGNIGPEHDTLAAVVEMVHLATLVHDDILDDSDMRRSRETVNRRWGTESAVLLGDYLFSHAFALCSSLESQFASQLIGKTANALCEGELIQVSRRNDFALTEETYFDIIARKTASLTQTCCTLGARYAGADPAVVANLAQFGRSLGMAFQIADDLLDLTGDEQETGKTAGRDVGKGKITLPIIHFLREQPEGRCDEMLAILNTGQAETRRRVSELLNESDSIEYAHDIARAHIATAVDSLSELPVTDARGALTAMAEFVLSRRG